MSDLEALYLFLNKPVSPDMIQFLVSTTTSIINVPDTYESFLSTPPSTPPSGNSSKPSPSLPPLTHFISRLIHHSHVQTPTLMTSLVYLNKLKAVIPPNSQGIETTHHRIFLGALILAAKFTNDSSPMNKHWTKYTDGLLTLTEVNALERELIDFIGWSNLRFTNKDLIKTFSYFIDPIKNSLRSKAESKLQSKYNSVNMYEDESSLVSPSPSMPSLMSSSSSSTISTQLSSSRTTSSMSLSSHIANENDAPLNIQLKPLRLPSNSNMKSLKHSKSNIRLSLNLPLTDVSNSNDLLSSY